MTRARREIQEKIKLIDVVVELVDARIPLSSRNPMIDEILQNKARLVAFNKFDLSDPIITQKWIQYFREQLHLDAVPIQASQGKSFKDIHAKIKSLWADRSSTWTNKGVNQREVRVLIVGIPNVGKSTLINQIVSKKIALTGDRPGITKGQQWIKLNQEMSLLDTPGILWPKFDDPLVGKKLAVTGAIKDDLLHISDIAIYAIQYLVKHYPHMLIERYEIDSLPQDEENTEAIIGILEKMGRQRGALVRGGQVDFDKISLLFLRDLRAGKLGRISLESPEIS